MKAKVAVIIPAYNEDKTIAEVIKVAKASDLVDEVVVVSDGSTDKTAAKAKRAGADKVVELPKKGGKGAALLRGIAETKAEIIIFLDADLRGLHASHIKKLVEPVLRGQKVMVAGLRDRGKFLSKLEKYLPLIGGERALQRFVIENIPERYLQGFKVEIALNYYCRSRGLPYGGVFLHGLNMRKKMEKVGVLKGLWQYIKMYWQVAMAMIAVRWAKTRGEF
jgi:cellulose synthase/poly-beta-1,6-N-acetylglucosamine synthase-like glycosyltransferase